MILDVGIGFYEPWSNGMAFPDDYRRRPSTPIPDMSGVENSPRLHDPPLAGWPRSHWRTPPHLLKLIHQVFDPIDVDPCPHPRHLLSGVMEHWTGRDSLRGEWPCCTFYVHPPIQDIEQWVDKVREENIKRQSEMILLVPVLTQFAWYQKIIARQPRVLLGRRLRLFSSRGKAVTPRVGYAFVYFGRFHLMEFAAAFGSEGLYQSL